MMISRFPVVCASHGTSSLSDDPADQEHTMAPILIPLSITSCLQLITQMNSSPQVSNFLDRLSDASVLDVFRGTVKVGDQATFKLDGITKKLLCYGLSVFWFKRRNQLQKAGTIAVSGKEDIFVGETITPKMLLRLFQSFISISPNPSNDFLG